MTPNVDNLMIPIYHFILLFYCKKSYDRFDKSHSYKRNKGHRISMAINFTFYIF